MNNGVNVRSHHNFVIVRANQAPSSNISNSGEAGPASRTQISVLFRIDCAIAMFMMRAIPTALEFDEEVAANVDNVFVAYVLVVHLELH